MHIRRNQAGLGLTWLITHTQALDWALPQRLLQKRCSRVRRLQGAAVTVAPLLLSLGPSPPPAGPLPRQAGPSPQPGTAQAKWSLEAASRAESVSIWGQSERFALPRPSLLSFTPSLPHSLISTPLSASTSMAMSNSLDLRPATAAAPETSTKDGPGSVDGIGSHHRFGSGRFSGMHVNVGGDHGDLIKETDLGGLSASLFTPKPGSARGTGGGGGGSGTAYGSPDSGGFFGGSGSGRGGDASGSHPASPSRLSTLAAAVNARSSADAAASLPVAAEAQGLVPAARYEEAAVLRGPMKGNPSSMISHDAGGSGQQQAGVAPAHSSAYYTGSGSSDDVATFPPQQRMVQSARPVTRSGQELDPGVWQDNIAAQVWNRPIKSILWVPDTSVTGRRADMPTNPFPIFALTEEVLTEYCVWGFFSTPRSCSARRRGRSRPTRLCTCGHLASSSRLCRTRCSSGRTRGHEQGRRPRRPAPTVAGLAGAEQAFMPVLVSEAESMPV